MNSKLTTIKESHSSDFFYQRETDVKIARNQKIEKKREKQNKIYNKNKQNTQVSNKTTKHL